MHQRSTQTECDANGHLPRAVGLSLDLDPEALAPLVERIVAEALSRLESEPARFDGSRLAYSEPEAAALLSLAPHQLRDERRRGRIKASVGPGRKVLYAKQDLLDYLMSRRWAPDNGNTGA
jgi:hypothetical protein